MGRYICGPSVLRLPGQPVMTPGMLFEYAFGSQAEERMALASGAIAHAPDPVETHKRETRQSDEGSGGPAAASRDVPEGTDEREAVSESGD